MIKDPTQPPTFLLAVWCIQYEKNPKSLLHSTYVRETVAFENYSGFTRFDMLLIDLEISPRTTFPEVSNAVDVSIYGAYSPERRQAMFRGRSSGVNIGKYLLGTVSRTARGDSEH